MPLMQDDDDDIEGLIDRACCGCDVATEELADVVRERALARARALMGPRAKRWQEPEDVAQIVTLEILDWVVTWKGPMTREVLYGRITRVTSWRVKDGARRFRRFEGDSETPPSPPEAPKASEGTVTRGDSFERVRREIYKLPDDWRDVMVLIRIEGLSPADAAEELGITLAAVKKRYERARRELRRRLRGENDE